MFFSRSEAARQARSILANPNILDSAIRCLVKNLETGNMDGEGPITCFFGCLGRGMGMDYEEMKHRLGVDTWPDIEQYCYAITPGMTPATSRRVRNLLMICRTELSRRKSIREAEKAYALEQLLQEVASDDTPIEDRELVEV